MTIEEVLTLSRAGFTADEIRAFGESTPTTAAGPSSPSGAEPGEAATAVTPAPAAEPGKEEPANPFSGESVKIYGEIAELRKTLEGLTTTLHSENLQKSSQPEEPEENPLFQFFR